MLICYYIYIVFASTKIKNASVKYLSHTNRKCKEKMTFKIIIIIKVKKNVYLVTI